MNIAIKAALASMVLLAGPASVAHAAGAGAGTVTFKGAIIEAACSIDPESVDQTVGLGQVAKSALAGVARRPLKISTSSWWGAM